MILRNTRTLVLLVFALTLGSLFAASSSQAALPVIYNVSTGLPGVFSPDSSPPGANDWNCKPTSAHPRPVILVNGTFTNQRMNWGTLSPLLKNNGYCVFTFNYGKSVIAGLTIHSVGPVAASAAELSTFVDRVRTATGVAKVDLVGHSQGGMMPNYYLKFLGGAPKVNALVGLAPSNHGTDVNGLLKLANMAAGAFPGLADAIYGALNDNAQGLADQKFDSPFMAQMNSVPDTVPGVKYTVIATKFDTIVTPYQTQFLSGTGVKNITIQNKCILDLADHVALAFDHVALREVLNALDPARARGTLCTAVLPLVGG